MSDVLLEANLVNLSDDELVKYICTLFERNKRLTEEAKIDEELNAMREALRDREYVKYKQEMKINTVKLKVAREHAKARDLAFKLPESI